MSRNDDLMTREEFYNDFDIGIKLSGLNSKHSCKYCGDGLDFTEINTYHDHCENCNKKENRHEKPVRTTV